MRVSMVFLDNIANLFYKNLDHFFNQRDIELFLNRDSIQGLIKTCKFSDKVTFFTYKQGRSQMDAIKTSQGHLLKILISSPSMRFQEFVNFDFCDFIKHDMLLY